MADFPLAEALQGFIYAALCVTSLGAMGITAEFCDGLETDCPGRLVTVIVFSLLVFLLAAPLFVAYAFEISFLKRIEIFLVIAILVVNIVATGVASSPKTEGNLFVEELSWWGLLLALAAFFLSLASGDRPKFEVSMKRDDTETGYTSQQGASVVSQPLSQPGYAAPAAPAAPAPQ